VRRQSAALPIAGSVLAVVGLVLLAVQVIRTLNDAVLGTVGTVLMWSGVGLLGIGLLLLVLAVSSEPLDGVTASGAAAPSAAEGGAEPARPVAAAAPADDWDVVPDEPTPAPAAPPAAPPASPPAVPPPGPAVPNDPPTPAVPAEPPTEVIPTTPPGPPPLHTPLPEPEPSGQPAGPADSASAGDYASPADSDPVVPPAEDNPTP